MRLSLALEVNRLLNQIGLDKLPWRPVILTTFCIVFNFCFLFVVRIFVQ